MLSPTGVAVVLPVKDFRAAKQRLRPAVNDADRERLARHLAAGVASVVLDWGARLLVACDDEAVAAWAADVGAEVTWTPGLGLNGAIAHGVRQAMADGAEHLLVTHADLARPSGLPRVPARHTATVVPDRHRDGTNAMSFPADAVITPDYGAGSFRRHLLRAWRAATPLGHSVRVLADTDLGLDVDTATDLRHPPIRQEMPSWLRTHPVSPSTPAG